MSRLCRRSFFRYALVFIVPVVLFCLASCKAVHPLPGYKDYVADTLILNNGYGVARIDSCVFYFLGQGKSLQAIHSWQCDYSKCPNTTIYRLLIRSPGRKVGYYRPPYNSNNFSEKLLTNKGDTLNSPSTSSTHLVDAKDLHKNKVFVSLRRELYFIDPKKTIKMGVSFPKYYFALTQHFRLKHFSGNERIN